MCAKMIGSSFKCVNMEIEKQVVFSRQFIEGQKAIIEERIRRYTDRERISEELKSGDVSPYTIYKQNSVVPQLRKALLLIEKGGYGLCSVCGNAIEKKRLEAVPAAFLCCSCLKG